MILLIKKRNINYPIKRSYVSSANGQDDRARTNKMVGARINDCCEDRDGRCKN